MPSETPVALTGSLPLTLVVGGARHGLATAFKATRLLKTLTSDKTAMLKRAKDATAPTRFVDQSAVSTISL